MKLKKLGSNVTEVELTGEVTVLFSYNTPVAAKIFHYETGEREYVKTETKWSVTTSKHINQWFGSIVPTTKPQKFFDDIVEPK